ncbi:TetR/AcrR family transcriptional regulator [Promicromonospora sp. NPDC050880]|uniref:TetR/AcrR family transcriptional regulator n=1 Tax=unclassified Promicromonospora TaxID=2647929 RepID=UPI00379F9772
MSVPASGRPARSDALRNRGKLVAAAQEVFAASDDTVSLERVARAAGVGIGTLYRHFPTREDLVEAVYGAELDAVAASAAELLGQLPPDQALRAWMDRYAAFVATKRGMLDTLRTGWATGRIDQSVTRERVAAALGSILQEGARTGVLRADVDPSDVAALLLGALLFVGAEGRPDRTERLLDLVAAGLRPEG